MQALLLALALGSAPAKPTFRDVVVVFHNDMWDDAWVDLDVRIFYTRDQVLAAAAELPGFAARNADFLAWARALDQPGFHVYSEGFEHHGALVTRLLERHPGWVCCGADRSFVSTAALRIASATPKQLRRTREGIPTAPADRRYFQMERYGELLRIWIHHAMK